MEVISVLFQVGPQKIFVLFQNEELSAAILVTEDISNENEIKSETNQAVESITEEIKKTEDDFNAATTYEQGDEKVRVEYMEPAGDYSISHVIIDSGQNFSGTVTQIYTIPS